MTTVAEMAKSPQARSFLQLLSSYTSTCVRDAGSRQSCASQHFACTDLVSDRSTPALTWLCSCLLLLRLALAGQALSRRANLQNIEALQQAGAMQLLRPLLLDNVPRCVHSCADCATPTLDFCAVHTT